MYGDRSKLIDPEALDKLTFENFIKIINELFKNVSQSLEQSSIVIEIRNFEQSKIIAKYISDLAINNSNPLTFSSKIIEIAINELLINAIEHGMLNINYELKTKLLENNSWEQYVQSELLKLPINKVVKIWIQIDPTESYKLLITIQDPGKGFDLKTLEVHDKQNLIHEKHGRGHILISTLENLKYEGTGNIVKFSVKYDHNLLNKDN